MVNAVCNRLKTFSYFEKAPILKRKWVYAHSDINPLKIITIKFS